MNHQTVLLADDDEGLRRLIAATLGTEAFTLLAAGDGDEAIAIAREARPELILLDIDMPGRSGLDVCRELKRDPETAGIKIVMLTASGRDSDRREAFDAQADDYFVKPFSPIALLDRVYALLD